MGFDLLNWWLNAICYCADVLHACSNIRTATLLRNFSYMHYFYFYTGHAM